MSDLAATNCQSSCNGGCGWTMGNGCNGSSLIWILFLLCFCGNGNSGWGGNDGCNSCDSLIWILLLLSFCGNGNSGFLGCGSCGNCGGC